MSEKSIFSEDWRECLRSHYTHVVREQDVKTERTLRGVMHNVGFGDDELNQLRVLATMHVDDVGADFVPELQILEESADVVGATHESPLQEDVPPENTDDVGTRYIVSEAAEATDEIVEEEPYEEPPQYDESGPEQLTMF